MVQMRKGTIGASLVAAGAMVSLHAQAGLTIPLSVSTLGDSLTLGHANDAAEYTRDFYGIGTLPGDSSNPGDAAYNPAAFFGWRANLQVGLSEQGFDVDMVGTLSHAADLPDTKLDGINAATFTTTGGQIITYDPDHNGHSGWHSGGTYDRSKVNDPGSGLYNGNNPGFGSWTYTPGQVTNNTYRATAVEAVDLIDTGSNGLTLDGASVFNRGLRDHLPEFSTPLGAADVVVIQIGINDLKNREDVEGSGVTVTERVENGNLQQRLVDLVNDVKTYVSPDTVIYLSNLATVNDDFSWASTADMQEAVEAFNQSLLDEYFGGAFIDAAGYTDAYAVGDSADGLDGVYLLNTHERIDELLDLSISVGGSLDYSVALNADGLHWTNEANDYVGEYFAGVIGATVPTPATAPLLAIGLGLIASRRRRG